MIWLAGCYAPIDGTPILVLEADGGAARTVAFMTIDDRTGWYSRDGKLIADDTADDFSIFAAGWVPLPPVQDKFARDDFDVLRRKDTHI